LSVRDAIDAALGGGIAGWVQRMRADHGGTVSTAYTPTGVYGGCRCGEVGCTAALWLAHVGDLIAAYEAKVQDLARETRRGVRGGHDHRRHAEMLAAALFVRGVTAEQCDALDQWLRDT